MLSDEKRYNRQLVLPEIGEKGQRKISNGSAAVVGIGALGGLSSILLARAGIGRIVVVDRDVVELDNLQRQILFSEEDVGRPKASVAAAKLRSMNSSIRVEALTKDVIPQNVLSILEGIQLVVDGTDNMETRFLLNDACVKKGLPFLYGGAVGTYGLQYTIIPGKSACLRCLMPRLPKAGSLPTCEAAGILNSVPSVIASFQATDAVKILVGAEVGGRLRVYNAWASEYEEIRVKRVDACPCCSKGIFEYLDQEVSTVVTSLCGRNTISVTPAEEAELNLESLECNLKKIGKTKIGLETLRLEVDSYTMTIFKDGRALISGTDDRATARSLYSKYIGT